MNAPALCVTRPAPEMDQLIGQGLAVIHTCQRGLGEEPHWTKDGVEDECTRLGRVQLEACWSHDKLVAGLVQHAERGVQQLNAMCT